MGSIAFESELPAPAALVWAAVQRPEAFAYVAGAMLRYPAAERLQGPIRPGVVITGWLLVFRVIPFSRHTIEIVSVEDVGMHLVTKEHGGVIRGWRHHITVEPLDDRRCRYIDRIEIDAGILTPVMVWLAGVFFRYRHRRWSSLAHLLAASVDGLRPRAGHDRPVRSVDGDQ